MKEQLILASASPRRQELLKQIAVSYHVHAVDIDESPHYLELPQDYVRRMAIEKSTACFAAQASECLILAGDTSVVIDNQILGKPINQQDAEAMLSRLSGKTHQVMTAISLTHYGTNRGFKHLQALSITDVCFKKIGIEEIRAYWQTGEPQGKAGAYAIQGLASSFIASIKGSYSGVMGLPLFETAELLSKQGIKIIT